METCNILEPLQIIWGLLCILVLLFFIYFILTSINLSFILDFVEEKKSLPNMPLGSQDDGDLGTFLILCNGNPTRIQPQ